MEVIIIIGGLILFGLMVAGLKSSFSETPAKQLEDARREGYEAAQRAAEDDAKASGSRYEAALSAMGARMAEMDRRLAQVNMELDGLREISDRMLRFAQNEMLITEKHEAMIRACADEISSIGRDRSSRPVARFVD